MRSPCIIWVDDKFKVIQKPQSKCDSVAIFAFTDGSVEVRKLFVETDKSSSITTILSAYGLIQTNLFYSKMISL